jgi:hypothetical protein
VRKPVRDSGADAAAFFDYGSLDCFCQRRIEHFFRQPGDNLKDVESKVTAHHRGDCQGLIRLLTKPRKALADDVWTFGMFPAASPGDVAAVLRTTAPSQLGSEGLLNE